MGPLQDIINVIGGEKPVQVSIDSSSTEEFLKDIGPVFFLTLFMVVFFAMLAAMYVAKKQF